MRFTIRELLLVTVIVGLAAGWWIDCRRRTQERVAIEKMLLLAEEKRTEAEQRCANVEEIAHELKKDLNQLGFLWVQA